MTFEEWVEANDLNGEPLTEEDLEEEIDDQA